LSLSSQHRDKNERKRPFQLAQASNTAHVASCSRFTKRCLVFLLATLGRKVRWRDLGRRLGARVVLGVLLVYLLEEPEGYLLDLASSLLELLGSDEGSAAWPLTANSRSLVINSTMRLLTLSSLELIHELVHGLLGISEDRVGHVSLLNNISALLVGLGVCSASSTMRSISLSLNPNKEAIDID